MKYRILFIGLLLITFFTSSAQVAPPVRVYDAHTINASETHSDFMNTDVATGGSDGICPSADEIKMVRVLRRKGFKIIRDHMISKLDWERVGNGKDSDRSYAKIKIDWNSCTVGTVDVDVYYRSMVTHAVITWECPPLCPKLWGHCTCPEIPVLHGECNWTDWRYMYTYRITREPQPPNGSLTSEEPYEKTASNSNGETQFNLKYSPDPEYKGFPAAHTLLYLKSTDATTATPISLNRTSTYYYPTDVPYTFKGFGERDVTAQIQDNCATYTVEPRTVKVMPKCHTDDPEKIFIIPVGTFEDKDKTEGWYQVQANTKYFVTVKKANGNVLEDYEDVWENYNLNVDVGDGTTAASDVVFDNNSFTVLKKMGSYRINLTVKDDRKTLCKTPLNELKVFVGGKDEVFKDICPIELPKDFAKLGFPDIKTDDISLKHFAGYVESQRTVTVMPGITLDEGAELFISRPPKAPTTDLNMNFVEQTGYDEYGRIVTAGRNYFDDLGKPIQTQVKNISKDVILANATLYDALGRPAISTLSAPIAEGKEVVLQCATDTQTITQLDFNYKKNFITNSNIAYDYTHFDLTNELTPLPVENVNEGTLGWYYSDNNGNSVNQNLNEPLVATTQYPYSRTLFKHDATGEVKGVTKPGDTFKAGSPYLATATSEPVYADDPYLNYYLNLRQTELKLPKPTVIEGGFLKTTTTDEVGKKSITYTDKSGLTLIALYFAAGESTPLTTSYQFYDNVGRLTVSISPNGIEQYKNNIAFADIDKTTHFYNARGLLTATEEKIAGQAANGISRSEFIYRKDGSIRFSQNAEQRNANPQRYSYTNYDKAGRPVESGEYILGEAGISFTSSTLLDVLENTDADGGILESSGIKRERSFSYYDEPDVNIPLGRLQRFVRGAVSYSRKDNTITTWYSYDERGRVEWMIQDIAGLGIKTIDYRYGPTGQVQDIVYQRGKDDQFVHYYEYDKDSRLFKAYTSRIDLVYSKQGALTNAGVLELQATYSYYLHGPLKRVELAHKLQGIDYVYTANGALKAINHANPLKDPGNDGSSNGVKPDVFGMTLDYFANDYTGAGYDAGTLSVTALGGKTYDEQYTGLIKANRWHGPVEPGKQFGYAYQYDKRNQFIQADWGNVDVSHLSITSKSPYKESIGSYDANGNIRSLQRNASLNRLIADNDDISLANFTYKYKGNTNMLQNITQPAGNGTENFRAYTYNDLGQMTQETEKVKVKDKTVDKTKYVVYDVTGKVTAVYADPLQTQTITTFQYDDRGFRLSKTTYDTSYVETMRTWYVRDASGNVVSTYEEDLVKHLPATVTEVPVYGSGKIGLYKPQYGFTFYELTDHLGNVRAVIGDTLTAKYTATIESELDDKEKKDGFINLNRANIAIYNTTPDHVVVVDGQNIQVTGDEICKINNQPTPDNNFTNNPIGVGKILRVNPGDKVRANVNAGYANFNPLNANPLAGLAGFLTKAFIGSPVIDGASIFSVVNDPEVVGLMAAARSDAAQPDAYLNYILFDNNFKFVAYNGVQVSSLAELNGTNLALENLSFDDVAIEKEGFMYIYVSSLTNQNMDVFFDDLKITHTYLNVVAGGDFYPYGLAIKDRQIDRERYPYGYQGQFAEKDDETGWNHFELREYDAMIGRTLTIDPARQFHSPYSWVGNNPVSGIDPTGGVNPIYDTEGNFLGTDDRGLQGEAIIMNSKDFTQGMSHADAIVAGTLFSNFSGGETATNAVATHFNTLPTRPDFDGIVTDMEARDWWQNGGGRPLYVNTELINLSPANTGSFYYKNPRTYNFFFETNSTETTGRVYGTLTLKLMNVHTGEVAILRNRETGFIDVYDFNNDGRFFRDLATRAARAFIVGEGTGFGFIPYGKNSNVKQYFHYSK